MQSFFSLNRAVEVWTDAALWPVMEHTVMKVENFADLFFQLVFANYGAFGCVNLILGQCGETSKNISSCLHGFYTTGSSLGYPQAQIVLIWKIRHRNVSDEESNFVKALMCIEGNLL
jgi:hypothetical protein